MPDFANFPGALGDYDRGVEYFLNLFLGVNERPQVRVAVCVADQLPYIQAPIPTSHRLHKPFNRRSSSTTT